MNDNPDKITDELDDFSDDDDSYHREEELDDELDDELNDEELDDEEEEKKKKEEAEEEEDVSITSQDEDEDRFKKLDRTVRAGLVQELHPEMVFRHTEEIDKMASVVRNRQGHIIDPLHRSLPLLTKYERARVLGERARQLEEGAQPFVKVPPEIVDSYLIAEMELKEKVVPFILERPMPNGGCEYWRLGDLEML